MCRALIDRKPLLEERMLGIDVVVLERAQARVQEDVGQLDAASLKREQEFPAERASGRRRLRGTGLSGEDRLVMTLEQSASDAPSRANANASARPRPRDAPVMSATMPSSRIVIALSELRDWEAA